MSDRYAGSSRWTGADPLAVVMAEVVDLAAGSTALSSHVVPVHLGHRRVNKKHKADSPEAKEVRLRGTEDIVNSVREKVDYLQEYSGADPYSYPGLRIVEAALVVAAQQREEFRRYFAGDGP